MSASRVSPPEGASGRTKTAAPTQQGRKTFRLEGASGRTKTAAPTQQGRKTFRLEGASGRVALVTGGSDGLGAELARWHQRNGDRVIAVGTRAESDLPSFFQTSPKVHYIRCDLAGDDSEQTIVSELHSLSIAAIDTLYLNAARGYYGSFEQQPLAEMEVVLRLSFLSPLLLLSALHNLIVPGGEVKVISSVVRYLPQANYALYAAAKAAISESMRSLIFERSVHYRITILHPGAIATGFHRRSGMGDARIALAQKPRTVARRVVEADGGVKIIGLHNRPWRLFGNLRLIGALGRRQLSRRRNIARDRFAGAAPREAGGGSGVAAPRAAGGGSSVAAPRDAGGGSSMAAPREAEGGSGVAASQVAGDSG